MADVTWSQLVAFAPQLAAITDVTVQAAIAGFANEYLEPLAFGGDGSYQYTLARLLLGAHEGTIVVMRGDTGKVASENISKESLSVSYAGGNSETAWDLTDYGKQLNTMVNASAYARAPIVV